MSSLEAIILGLVQGLTEFLVRILAPLFHGELVQTLPEIPPIVWNAHGSGPFKSLLGQKPAVHRLPGEALYADAVHIELKETAAVHAHSSGTVVTNPPLEGCGQHFLFQIFPHPTPGFFPLFPSEISKPISRINITYYLLRIYSVAPFVVGADAHIRPRLQAKIGR